MEKKEMNYNEMLNTFSIDYFDCLNFIRLIRKKISKRISKATIYPVNLGPFEIEAKSKLKYLIYISAYSKKDCMDPFITIVNYNETSVGYKANMIFLNSNGINVISYFENVFKSYKNYFYEDTASEFGVLKEYFKTNPTNVSEVIGNELIFGCKDGLLTGFDTNKGIKIMHSFTPNDLIENGLNELSSNMQNELKQIIELKRKSVV